MLVAGMLASWPDCGLMPVAALNTANQSCMNSILPLMPTPDCERLFGAMSHCGRLPFIVIGTCRHAVANPAHARVKRAVQGDAVPGQWAIGVDELLEARAGGRWSARSRYGGLNILGARRLSQN